MIDSNASREISNTDLADFRLIYELSVNIKDIPIRQMRFGSHA